MLACPVIRALPSRPCSPRPPLALSHDGRRALSLSPTRNPPLVTRRLFAPPTLGEGPLLLPSSFTSFHHCLFTSPLLATRHSPLATSSVLTLLKSHCSTRITRNPQRITLFRKHQGVPKPFFVNESSPTTGPSAHPQLQQKRTPMPHKSHRQPLCQHHTASGRRCRMLQSPNHETLCTFHATAEAKLLAQAKIAEAKLLAATKRAEAQSHRSHSIEQVAADLLAGTENLSQPTSVNLFLSNLLKNFAHHRISRRDATTLAYISQLLLNSQSVIHRQAKDAQAATAQAAANEPQRIVIDMPRPHHADRSCSGGSSDPFLSPTTSPIPSPSICSGESSDSHPDFNAPPNVHEHRHTNKLDAKPKTCHPVCPDEGRERSEEPTFPATSTES